MYVWVVMYIMTVLKESDQKERKISRLTLDLEWKYASKVLMFNGMKSEMFCISVYMQQNRPH